MSFLLDTNVISELARPVPDAGVLSWLDSLDVADVATTAVTAAKLNADRVATEFGTFTPK